MVSINLHPVVRQGNSVSFPGSTNASKLRTALHAALPVAIMILC